MHIKVLLDLVIGDFREGETGKEEGGVSPRENGTESGREGTDMMLSAFDHEMVIIISGGSLLNQIEVEEWSRFRELVS